MSLGKEYVIALVDCDCFYVSCERVDNPNLNGRAVCVVTTSTNKGIVLSRSNEAKAFGIKMGQPMFQLNGRHLDCFYIPCRHKRYAELSRQVMAVFREFSPDVEEVSVDEAFLDLTGMSKMYGLSYEKLAHQIRQRVFEKTKIPVCRTGMCAGRISGTGLYAESIGACVCRRQQIGTSGRTGYRCKTEKR